jgi:pseudaminic acid synthase
MIFSFKKITSVFIVAELSANHNGSLETAKKTIKAAKKAGANAIKLQTYTPDTITIKSQKNDFLISNNSIWDGMYLYDLYNEAYTPWEWHRELFEISKDLGLECFSTPFDKTSVDFLEELNVSMYKIASFEITDIPLIEYVASTGKPIILSTGIADLNDIETAIKTIRKIGNNEIALLKCTSSYPSPPEESNLIMIQDFKERFDLIPGLSDHTLGIQAPVIATSLGAKIIEKHFILDKSVGGPDSSFSLDQEDFTKMVNAIREAEVYIGKVDYNLSQRQILSKQFSRSLYVTREIKKGECFSEKNVQSKRPGYGLHPKHLKDIIGKESNRDIEIGERFDLKYIKK